MGIAAGIDDLKGTPVPFYGPVDTISGDAGLIGHDGSALSDQTIENCGFADVGTPDDGNQGE
jgi:hypothetical protein